MPSDRGGQAISTRSIVYSPLSRFPFQAILDPVTDETTERRSPARFV